MLVGQQGWYSIQHLLPLLRKEEHFDLLVERNYLFPITSSVNGTVMKGSPEFLAKGKHSPSEARKTGS